MSTAGQQPPPSLASSSIPGDAASFLCRTCGCINFSSDDDCDKCRAAKQPSGESTAPRHPFLRPPHKRPSASMPRWSAPSPGPAPPGPQQAKSSVGGQANVPTGQQLVNAAASGHSTPVSKSPVPVAGHKTAQLGVSGVSSNGRLDAPAQGPGATPPVGAPRPAPRAASEDAESTKRSHDATTAKKKSEIIVLISSDEDSEDGRKRAAKRARHEARLKQSVASLALRKIDEPAQNERASATRAVISDSEEHVRSIEPPQARSFDQVEFNPSDFPNQLEVSQALRQRHAAPAQTKTASIIPPPVMKTAPLAQPAASDPKLEIPVVKPVTVEDPSHLPSVTSDTSAQSAPVVTASAQSKTMILSSQSSEHSTAAVPDMKPSITPTSTSKIVQPTTTRTTAPTTIPVTTRIAVPYPPIASAPALVPAGTSGQDNSQQKISRSTSLSSVPTSSTGPSPISSFLQSSPVETSNSVVPVPPAATSKIAAAQSPIVVDDSDEEEICDGHGSALFQSRRFDSIAFNPRDFATANDGLNLARRSNPLPRVPPSPEATQAEPVEPTTLIARKKSQPSSDVHGVSTMITSSTPSPPADVHSPVIKKEVAPAIRIIKPMLGHCSADFLQFMRDCVDHDDDQDDEDLARARLHEIVDLTNSTDDSGDEDEDEDDDYIEIVEIRAASNGFPSDSTSVATALNGPTTTTTSANPLSETKVRVTGENGSTSGLPVIKAKRAPRPKETCMLCEEKGWIKSLVNCSDCKKYYHKRCAREYGDETKCWNCDLEGMIDDSELTEVHKHEVVSMFGALRQSPDSDTGEDGGDEEELEEKAEGVEDGEGKQNLLPVLDGKTTRSMRRWKQFLDVTTAPVEKSFNDVTSVITRELQDDQRKSKYTRGFATKESVEKAMAEVVDHYADLQDKEERLLREERARSVVEGAGVADQLGSDEAIPLTNGEGTVLSEVLQTVTATVAR